MCAHTQDFQQNNGNVSGHIVQNVNDDMCPDKTSGTLRLLCVLPPPKVQIPERDGSHV